jgi:hypothetical protein
LQRRRCGWEEGRYKQLASVFWRKRYRETTAVSPVEQQSDKDERMKLFPALLPYANHVSGACRRSIPRSVQVHRIRTTPGKLWAARKRGALRWRQSFCPQKSKREIDFPSPKKISRRADLSP